MQDLEQQCINTIRTLAMDAVEKAKSGHPGMPMGMAPAAHLLWTKFLRYNPRNPNWANRDRFVLSAGHGSMLQYALLYLTGYDLSLEQIKQFRQLDSKTPGHPEPLLTKGVEVTTGPLGQGISNAIGMAIAQKYLAAHFNRDDFPIIDYTVYVFASDGDLEEGVSSEASSLAGHLGLDNLIVIYDDNHISIDGDTKLAFTENTAKRYEAYGWFVQKIKGDGNDITLFDTAIVTAKKEADRPSFIQWRTHIGYGSPNKQDTEEAHGSPLGSEEIALTKKFYKWGHEEAFTVPKEVLNFYRQQVTQGKKLEDHWKKTFTGYQKKFPDLADQFIRSFSGKLPKNWNTLWKNSLPKFDSTPLATREAQGKLLDKLMINLPLVIGGAGDLADSTKALFKEAPIFTKTNRTGRYIHYGVREHGMGAIMNGIAATGLVRPYGATYFCFTDYMRPAIRLAAVSHYPVIFVYTHDSIGLGEDGPTHQPIEHLASFRAMPGITLIRPADAYETMFAWKYALENRDGPVMLVLTRQKIPIIDQKIYSSAENLNKGAYILHEPSSHSPKGVIIATGSEVHLALEAATLLEKSKIPVRVVSMPSWDLFEKQTTKYKETVLPSRISSRLAIEAGSKLGWERYIGNKGIFIGMSGFGASAPADDVFRHFGFTSSNIVQKMRSLIEN